MDCAAVKPRMEALVNGSLPETERELAEQHISICEGCRLELELVRAIGSQEKPPAVGHDDWTLDRIFGTEGQQSGGSQSDPAPESPAPAFPPQPSIFPSSGPGTTGGRVTVSGSAWDHGGASGGMTAPPESSPAGKALEGFGSAAASGGADSSDEEGDAAPPSWDFEPADAKADVKPPQESLFFAAEALTRLKDPEAKKGSNVRVMIWGVGGVIGAVLLAVSSWFVLHMKAPSSEGTSPSMEAPANPTKEREAPFKETPRQPTDPGTVAPPAEEGPPPGASDAPDNTAQHPPVPRVSASSTQPPQPPGALRASGLASARNAPPPADPTQAHATPRPAASRTPVRPAPSNPGPPRSAQPPASIPKPAPWVPPPDDEEPVSPPEPAKAQARTFVPPPVEKTAPNEAESTNEEPTAAPEPAPPPAQEKPRSQSWLDAHAGSAQRSGSSGGTDAPRASAAPTTSPSASKPSTERPPAPEARSPFDRLHLATVAAGEQGDLDQLRRLKASWKSFMSKMGVGSQRALAKREYADCLWGIQSLTGGRADQKNALAAYREYLLGAPAGGADSRSVSRLRQLEDALAERR